MLNIVEFAEVVPRVNAGRLPCVPNVIRAAVSVPAESDGRLPVLDVLELEVHWMYLIPRPARRAQRAKACRAHARAAERLPNISAPFA